MITADGWLSWAHREPGPADKVYSTPNTAEMYLPHDAVGYLRGWYSRLFDLSGAWQNGVWRYTPNAAASVHGIVLDEIDPATGVAKVIEHYPLTASCWASGSRIPNTRGIAFENERRRDLFDALPLPPHMVAANVRIIRELSEWKGWTPRRPRDAHDMTATLYTHRECVRFGSASTACESGRAAPVWAALEEDDMTDEEKKRLDNAERQVYSLRRDLNAFGLAFIDLAKFSYGDNDPRTLDIAQRLKALEEADK